MDFHPDSNNSWLFSHAIPRETPKLNATWSSSRTLSRNYFSQHGPHPRSQLSRRRRHLDSPANRGRIRRHSPHYHPTIHIRTQRTTTAKQLFKQLQSTATSLFAPSSTRAIRQRTGRDNGGRTALTLAAGAEHLDIIDELLNAGTEVNTLAHRYMGHTALQAAAEGRHIHIVRNLLSQGAAMNAAAAHNNGRTTPR